jgi:hypothetical protein
MPWAVERVFLAAHGPDASGDVLKALDPFRSAVLGARRGEAPLGAKVKGAGAMDEEEDRMFVDAYLDGLDGPGAKAVGQHTYELCAFDGLAVGTAFVVPGKG